MTNTDTADAAGTAEQVAALARAGSQMVRVTVNNDEAARAVPEIVQRLADDGVDVPAHRRLPLQRPPAAHAVPGVRRRRSTSTASTRATSAAAPRRELPHHRAGRRRARQAGAHRRQLGLARPGRCSPQMMDANAQRRAPRDAKDVYIEAMLESALRSAALAEEVGLGHDRIIISRQGLRGAGPGGGVPAPRDALRLPAAPRAHRGRAWAPRAWLRARPGCRSCSARASATRSASRSRRARRRPRRGGARGAADPAVARPAQLRAAGDRLPRLRPHHVHLLPADGRGHPGLPARADAGVARAAPGRGGR